MENLKIEKNEMKLRRKVVSTKKCGMKIEENRKNRRGHFRPNARRKVAFARSEVVLARVGVGIGQAGNPIFSTGGVQMVKNLQEKWVLQRKKRPFGVSISPFCEYLFHERFD